MSREQDPKVVMDFINSRYNMFPSKDAIDGFAWRFDKLWDATPKEEWQGLNPDEMDLSLSIHNAPKIGRNELCWCGSEKKYKKCHGK